MDIELLNWSGNFLNFLILAFLSITIVNTQCFNVYQMSLSLFGLLVSIMIQIVSILYRKYMLTEN